MPAAQLYDLADELYRLAPWQWMYEDQLIGLRHPHTGELAQISIMGVSGEHLCLALYLGEAALHRFNLIHAGLPGGDELPQEDNLALILESRQLQVSFDGREQLSKAELAEIKKLGRKYRGVNYPKFSSFHPGRCPMRIDEAEAEWLLHALTQVLEVAPAIRAGHTSPQRRGEHGPESLTREFHDGAWRTTWLPIDSRLYEFPTPAPDAALAAKVAQHPTRLHVECQFQIIPQSIGTRASAVYPYAVLSVDSESGFVFGMELASVEKQSHEALLASVPDHFLRMWDRNQIYPASLHVSTLATQAMLEKTAASLSIPLVLEDDLPALQEALSSFMGFMGGGGF